MYLHSVGLHEDRLKNLHFLFAAVVKAVYRATPLLESYNYVTELDPASDELTHRLVHKLLGMPHSYLFSEDEFFSRIDDDF